MCDYTHSFDCYATFYREAILFDELFNLRRLTNNEAQYSTLKDTETQTRQQQMEGVHKFIHHV